MYIYIYRYYIILYIILYILYIIYYIYYILYYLYICTTERLLEVAIESWPEWNLNPRLLNSVQTL